MKAGELNTTITFQQATNTYDTVNEPILSWADAFTVYATKITTGSKEFYAAQKKNTETTAVFRIRFRLGIRPDMRIKCGNEHFEILGKPNDVNNKHKELLISAKEVV